MPNNTLFDLKHWWILHHQAELAHYSFICLQPTHWGQRIHFINHIHQTCLCAIFSFLEKKCKTAYLMLLTALKRSCSIGQEIQIPHSFSKEKIIQDIYIRYSESILKCNIGIHRNPLSVLSLSKHPLYKR